MLPDRDTNTVRAKDENVASDLVTDAASADAQAANEPTAAAAVDRADDSDAGADIQGFIERVERSRVSGWVWDKNDPAAALDVEIRLDDRLLTTTRADRFRRDLRDGGVGDGHHAFQAFLDEAMPVSEPHRVSAVARTATDGTAVALVNLKAAPAPAASSAAGNERPAAVEVRQWLQAMSAENEAFRAASRTALQSIRTAVADSANTTAATAEQMAEMRTMVDQLAQQMAALEVFQTRLDAVHASLERAPGGAAASTRTDRGLKIVVALLSVVSIASLAIGLWSIAG